VFIAMRQASGQTSLQDRIRIQIESDILAGIRPPGSAIDEKELAAAFEASRTPVREALIALSAQGLVTIAPRSGIYVRKASLAELVSALEAISELEAVVAGLAANRATSAHIESMMQALELGAKAALAEDIARYRHANTQLHEAMHQAGANPVLADHIRSSRRLLMAYPHRSFEMPGRLKISNQEHHEIVHAIRLGDVALAQSSMKSHISRGGEAMIALLRSAREGLVD